MDTKVADDGQQRSLEWIRLDDASELQFDMVLTSVLARLNEEDTEQAIKASEGCRDAKQTRQALYRCSRMRYLRRCILMFETCRAESWKFSFFISLASSWT